MLTYCACFSIGLFSSALASIPFIASDLMNKKNIWETVSVFSVFGIIGGLMLTFVNWATKY